VFKLSDTEAKAYSDLRSSKDPKVLKGLEPQSVARLYIQTLIDFDPETQYTLYDTESGIDGWSLQEHLEITRKEGRMSRDVIYNVFVPYSSGEVKINGDEAVIVYGTGSDLHIFKLRKTSENIWKVSFLPIQ